LALLSAIRLGIGTIGQDKKSEADGMLVAVNIPLPPFLVQANILH